LPSPTLFRSADAGGGTHGDEPPEVRAPRRGEVAQAGADGRREGEGPDVVDRGASPARDLEHEDRRDDGDDADGDDATSVVNASENGNCRPRTAKRRDAEPSAAEV